MKRFTIATSILSLMMMLFIACSGDNNDNTDPNVSPDPKPTNGKTLVAYFSQTVPEGVDATTGATNVVRENGNDYGAAQYLALMVARKTDADTLRLTAASGHYPVEYNDLAAFARTERDNNTHPALTSRRVNMADYTNIIVVTPIWWYTVPMPVYSFLDAYDLNGKSVFVATTHAGSGLADAVAVIRKEEPNAKVSNKGFAVSASNVSNSISADVDRWLQQTGLTGR